MNLILIPWIYDSRECFGQSAFDLLDRLEHFFWILCKSMYMSKICVRHLSSVSCIIFTFTMSRVIKSRDVCCDFFFVVCQLTQARYSLWRSVHQYKFLYVVCFFSKI